MTANVEPACGPGCSSRAREPRRRATQKLVVSLVTKSYVDDLEAVGVQEHKGARVLVAIGAGRGLSEAVP